LSKLRLTFACWNYDRTRAMLEERVQPEGIDLNYVSLPVEETFFRMLRYKEFDIAEMSLSSYVMSLFKSESPFVAIPVFPSRSFRHSCIYINAASGINDPKDVIGKKVGNPEYQLTAPVWIRGIMADEYGVPVNSVTYYAGGQEEPGRTEKLTLEVPREIRIERIRPDQTLSSMLANGEIDALYTPRMPSSFRRSGGQVRRLFENFAAIERDYFRRTRIFPIMHTVVIRREIYERNRWISQSLFKAFRLAQQEVYDDLNETAALKVMLPWLPAYIEETQREMGTDFWPYGLQSNQHTLATFLRYSYEQGLSKRLLEPGELFAPETLESFKI
jgi:4,5-dihydroxyphthalate decarboxylase